MTKRNLTDRNEPPAFQHPWLDWVMRELDLSRPDMTVVRFMQVIYSWESGDIPINERKAREILDQIDQWGGINQRVTHGSGYVYFIQWGDRIKIGTAKNPASRARGMSLPPSAIVATVPGGRALERQLHEQFADSRIPKSEWFHATDELLEFIATL